MFKIAKGLALLSSAMMMLFSLSPALFAHKSSFEPGALTAPPPMIQEGDSSYSTIWENAAIIQRTGSQINNNGKEVQISASTQTYTSVEKLWITIYIERWDGTSWNTISTGVTTSDENKMNLYASQNYIIIAGYYYRGRTVHSVEDNSIQETKNLYTNHVLVPL